MLSNPYLSWFFQWWAQQLVVSMLFVGKNWTFERRATKGSSSAIWSNHSRKSRHSFDRFRNFCFVVREATRSKAIRGFHARAHRGICSGKTSLQFHGSVQDSTINKDHQLPVKEAPPRYTGPYSTSHIYSLVAGSSIMSLSDYQRI